MPCGEILHKNISISPDYFLCIKSPLTGKEQIDMFRSILWLKVEMRKEGHSINIGEPILLFGQNHLADSLQTIDMTGFFQVL